MNEVLLASLIGFATTSSAMAGAAIGLYYPLSKRSLACVLAFAAGALISALAIDLAYQGAVHLHHAGFSQRASWAFIGGGFAHVTCLRAKFYFGAGAPGDGLFMVAKAAFKPKKIFALWSTVLVAGMLAAAVGKAFISSPESLVAIFCEPLAGGAVLALVAHAMFPEALHQGGSIIVLPTVAGFLFALYLSLTAAVV